MRLCFTSTAGDSVDAAASRTQKCMCIPFRLIWIVFFFSLVSNVSKVYGFIIKNGRLKCRFYTISLCYSPRCCSRFVTHSIEWFLCFLLFWCLGFCCRCAATMEFLVTMATIHRTNNNAVVVNIAVRQIPSCLFALLRFMIRSMSAFRINVMRFCVYERFILCAW